MTNLALCGLVLAAWSTTSSARAATLTVANLNDSGPGSLRQAIADAAAGDTITFGVEGTITLTNGALTISQDLTIEGPGPHQLEISGNHASRVFFIQEGTVTLAGMWIRDGLADGNSPNPSTGGGVFNSGNLVLRNDVLSANAALGDKSSPGFGWFGASAGGAVANYGTLEIKECAFIGNLARGADGSRGQVADGFAAGGAVLSVGEMHVSGSHFTGNVARGGSHCRSDWFPGGSMGGAIGHSEKLTITGSTFSHNQSISGNDNNGYASGNAFSGAIHIGCIGGATSLEVRDSLFHHNQAIGGNGNTGDDVFDWGTSSGAATGGAIHSDNIPATISGCTLDHNEAIGGTGAAGRPGGAGLGGGIDATAPGAKITVTNCTVEYNLALGGSGGSVSHGAVGVGGGLRSDSVALTIINTKVAHNIAQGGAGNGGGNGGNGGGGGLQTWMGSLIVEGTIVTNNWALCGEPGGRGVGGGVFNQLGTFTCDIATVVASNHAFTSNNDLAEVANLAIALTPGKVTLTFDGTLEMAEKVSGPWIELPRNSPLAVTTSGSMKFYRAKR